MARRSGNCRKVFKKTPLEESFLDKSLKFYQKRDSYHGKFLKMDDF